jgi:hypothetical protein
MQMNTKIIGIFTDADNTNPSVIDPIIRAAKNSGSIGAFVLFGNRNSPSLSPWNAPQVRKTLESLGAVWSPLPPLRPGKNAADIALTYEAALMTSNGTINQVWIISGDSDFTPLVERLSAKQIHVVVFGPKNTPPSLRKACSCFVLLTDVQNGTRTSVADSGETQPPLSLRPDTDGWYHGFIRSLNGTFGFIHVDSPLPLFFCGSKVDAPFTIRDFEVGGPVRFKIGRNHIGWMAIHVQKVFALQAA